MSKTITVNVTEEDIRRGVKCDGNSCPIALALTRLVGPHAGVSVGDEEICIESWTGITPPTAVDFVVQFDAELPGVAPFSFDLEIPDDIEVLPAENQL